LTRKQEVDRLLRRTTLISSSTGLSAFIGLFLCNLRNLRNLWIAWVTLTAGVSGGFASKV
jgi:hypothetical protein